MSKICNEGIESWWTNFNHELYEKIKKNLFVNKNKISKIAEVKTLKQKANELQKR